MFAWLFRSGGVLQRRIPPHLLWRGFVYAAEPTVKYAPYIIPLLLEQMLRTAQNPAVDLLVFGADEQFPYHSDVQSWVRRYEYCSSTQQLVQQLDHSFACCTPSAEEVVVYVQDSDLSLLLQDKACAVKLQNACVTVFAYGATLPHNNPFPQKEQTLLLTGNATFVPLVEGTDAAQVQRLCANGSWVWRRQQKHYTFSLPAEEGATCQQWIDSITAD